MEGLGVGDPGVGVVGPNEGFGGGAIVGGDLLVEGGFVVDGANALGVLGVEGEIEAVGGELGAGEEVGGGFLGGLWWLCLGGGGWLGLEFGFGRLTAG